MELMQFFDMMLHVDKYLATFVAQYGTLIYAILFAIIFCETGLVVFPFLPGDTLLFVAGALCAAGSIDIWLLMTLLVVAAIAGNTVNYWIGVAIGHKVYTHNYRWLDQKLLQRTHAFYENHGGKTIVLSRFIPLVRTFAPFVAGVSAMTFSKFQLYNVTGGLLWVVGLVSAGYFFGNIPIVRDHLSVIVLIGVGAVMVPVAAGMMWKLLRRFMRRPV